MLKHIYAGLFCSLFLLSSLYLSAQMPGSDPRGCQDDGVISLAFSGDTELNTCTDDDVMDRVRFQVVPFRQAFAYVVVDAGNIIRSIGFSNFINFDLLPSGQLRVYGFSNYGRITASVGDDFTAVPLSTPCAGLTTNFVTVNNGRSGSAVDITSAQTSYTTCAGDGEADIVMVSSMADEVTFVITDESGTVLAVNETGAIDFEGAGVGICRVYALGLITIEPGDNISSLDGQGGCGGGLSEDFITVNRISVDGGTVTTADGATEILTCPNDGVDDVVDFTVSGTTGDGNRLVVTDANNIIIGLPPGNSVNFEGAGVGVCRVWNLSFTGEFTGEEGDDLATADLSSGCADLSDEFVTVVREVPVGGTVATADGETEVSTCPGDGNDDLVTAVNTGATGGAVAYLITDSDNTVLGFSADNPTFNVEGAGVGVCRIWTVTYQGNLTIAEGINAAESDLSDECYELSSNFITVTRSVPAGGTVATVAGDTEITTCPGDGMDDFIEFASAGAEGANFTFVVTDADNNILGVPGGNMVNFEGAGVGACRLWGLSYSGNLLAEMGDNLDADQLASDCFGLSENFVTVNRITVAGGTVTTIDGDTEINTCPGDGNDDVIDFTVSDTDGESSRLVVTDADNMIIGLPPGNSVNFEEAGTGVCRVWNLTFTGEFIGMIGDDAAAARLATSCFALSDNFVTVVRDVPVGGTVATADGATEVETCPGDGNDDLVTAVNTGAAGGSVAYLITDSENTVLGFSADNPTFNVEGAGVGVCRIWTVTYRGDLTIAEGDNAGESALSDECFTLSENFITVTRSVPAGGTVSTADGETEITTCPGDGNDDFREFVSLGATGANFNFIVTDSDNNILGVPGGNMVNFEDAGTGTCRLWGLSYAGELLAEMGDNLDSDPLASECFSLSTNFVTVTRELPVGGTVSLEDGSTMTITCPGDGQADLVTVESFDAIGENFAFIITDNDGMVLGIPAGNTLDFEIVPPGTCRIYGVSYSGMLLVNQGDDLASVELATECASLSDNFVTVVREEPTTGTISTEEGDTEIMVCPGDAVPDVIRFDSTGTSLSNFNYLITDANGIVIRVAFTHEINFENFGVGVCRVYGLGYDGIVQASLGDIIGEDPLATGCFKLSENFVTVTKETPDGGTIQTTNQEMEVMVCSMDGVPDLVAVETFGESGARYAYIATTNENVILTFQDQAVFDFEQAAFGTCRIWGLAYQGAIVAQPGDTLMVDRLATGCSDLSDNFVTVIREAADAGTIQLAGGGDVAVTCPGDGLDDLLEFERIDATGARLLSVITDSDNLVIGIGDGVLNFENAGVGVCRVWTIAFAGDLLISMDDTLTTAQIATGCFDLSDNFVTVIREVPDAGSVSLEMDGSTEISFCTGDPMMDSLVFVNDATTAANYAYIITEDSLALLAVTEDNFDFSNALTGTYMVYGIAYTGNLNVTPGLNIFENDLSDACFDLSDNAITINVTRVDNISILGNGAEEVYLCSDNPDDGLVEFTSGTLISGANFTYVITTPANIIIRVIDGDSFDFGSLPLEELKVYGISYTGNFLVDGAFPLSAPLSDDCFTISNNCVTIFNDEPEAGEIAFDGVPSSGISCSVDGDGDIAVTTTSTSLTGYAILVTDTANIVQLVALDPANVPLGDLPPGDYRVHGVAYTGNIIVQVGEDVDVVALADNCYELTAEFLTITQGGSISAGVLTNLNGVGDTIAFCIPDGDNPIAIVDASVVGINYRYIVTDADGIILAPNLPSSVIPFGPFGPGEYRIYGFNFTGIPTVSVNQSIDGFLSTECYAVTSNFLTVLYEDPDGGMVTTTGGETEISLEIDNDGNASAQFMTTSDSLYNDAYVITDEDNNILGISTSNEINFGGAGVGVCRVWNLAFTGEVLAMMGDNAATTILTDGCYNLSDNFVTVTRTDDDNFAPEAEGESDVHGVSNFTLTAYPNPSAGGEIYLAVESDLPLPSGQVYVRDLNGRAYAVRPLTGGSNTATIRLDISTLPSGMYFAQFQTNMGLQSVRFMKR